jgi:hypothetical protein
MASALSKSTKAINGNKANHKKATNTEPNAKRVNSEAWSTTPVLLHGENESVFNAIATSLRGTLDLSDPIELLLGDTIIAEYWEVRRCRRLRAGSVRSGTQQALRHILGPLVGPDRAVALSRGWTIGETAATEEVMKTLATAQLTLEDVSAASSVANIDSLARFDGLQASAEARLSRALDSLRRHRETKAAAKPPILDGDFEDVAAADSTKENSDDE